MFARALSKVARVARPVAQRPTLRFFSDVLDIPTDKEQQWGRRKEELEAEARGEIGFDHLASIVPPADAGTKENPILIPTGEHHRTVGFEHPGTHQLVWFNIDTDDLHFIPDLNLYFKLKHIGGHGHH